MSSSSSSFSMEVRVCSHVSTKDSKTNCVMVSKSSFERLASASGNGSKPEVFGVTCQIRNMVFNVKPSNDAKDGYLLTNKFQRRSASLIEDSKHTLRVFPDPQSRIAFKYVFFVFFKSIIVSLSLTYKV